MSDTNYAEKYEKMAYREWSKHFRKGDHIIDRAELEAYTTEANVNDLEIDVPDYDQPRDTQKVHVLVYVQFDADTEDRVHGRG